MNNGKKKLEVRNGKMGSNKEIRSLKWELRIANYE